MGRSRIARTLAALALLSACNPHDDVGPDASSEHFDLFLYDDIEVCAGTLPALERFVTNGTERIGDSLPTDWRAELHAMASDTLHDGGGPCPTGAGGCARGGAVPRAWFTASSSAFHETVHLLGLETVGFPPPALDEGLATNWGNPPLGRFVVERQVIEDLLSAPISAEIWAGAGAYNTYYHAAALTHMLLGDYGDAYFDLFAELARDASYDDIATAFPPHFGDPLDVVLDRLTGAYQCTEPLWVCAESEAEPNLPIEIFDIDCNDAVTAGFRLPDSPGMRPYQIVRFSLDADTLLEMTLTNVSVTFHACGRCDIETAIISSDAAISPEDRDMRKVQFNFQAGVWTAIVATLDPYDEDSYFSLRVAD